MSASNDLPIIIFLNYFYQKISIRNNIPFSDDNTDLLDKAVANKENENYHTKA